MTEETPELWINRDAKIILDANALRRLEMHGITAPKRVNVIRDEMLRRAIVVACRLPATTPISRIREMGKSGLESLGVSLVYHRHIDPRNDTVVVYRVNEGRRERALFWVKTPVALIDPGGHPLERKKGEIPHVTVTIPYGGDPEILYWMREKDWTGGWKEERPEVDHAEHEK